ncbi:integral membrane protein GPR155 isoform X1 [Octopus bimaculoides]|uniref:DEP domain-containing protein n=2 Tax=Octopus bimaculoides TaxID=37653 RepID=A0A0L8GNW0_OCTBM|nr:integral membrane protein GPR155 isoform X1 [Octopus bimaculoides]XP_052826126.1 integral membrane protein GPR155 isoform X1 [Octopus bimaculoides]XP_052826127.1 integral membrane protein GPR155 isoform X1 [Octopus bimaculoides]|eukprot:XP_014779397.1 PREDICTED: integral membrane protein GPR155-like [Octopus bimaculoides]
MNNSTIVPNPGDCSINNLYPAIVQCFAVIFAGYWAGWTKIITFKTGKSIGIFVWNFCLPAMVMQGMWELHWEEVNYKFILCVLVSKLIIFTLVILVTFITYRPINFGYAGIFGIFTTCSNDFALGYPILKALYGDNSIYLKYIYLFAPISLALINPICFIMMEIHKNRNPNNFQENRKRPYVNLKILVDVIKNPIVFMTILGIMFNFIFQQTIPIIIKNILTVLGNAFAASALFYLGLNLVGKTKNQLGIQLVVPFLLVLAKTLLLPLVTWQVIYIVKPGANANETSSLSMNGFLYGTFPTAPSAFIYASQYSIATTITASGLVLCTIFSAPLMFISARMMTFLSHHPSIYSKIIRDTTFDISTLSLVFCVWICVIFVITRRWKKVPHLFTLCLAISQIFRAIGLICCHSDRKLFNWQHYVEFIFINVGDLSSNSWTCLLSITICILRTRQKTDWLQNHFLFSLIGFGLPVFLTGILFLISWKYYSVSIDPTLQYGLIQIVIKFVILLISITITSAALIIGQRKQKDKYQLMSSNSNQTDKNPQERSENAEFNHSLQETLQPSSINNDVEANHFFEFENQTNQTNVNFTSFEEQSIEDLDLSPNSTDLNDSKVHLLENYFQAEPSTANSDIDKIEITSQEELPEESLQISKHIILLLCLLFSMCISLFLNFWRLMSGKKTGTYVEVVFFHGVLSSGLGLILFVIFGFDVKMRLGAFLASCRCFKCCSEGDGINKIDGATQLKCHQFKKYHKTNCRGDVERDIRYNLKVYRAVFPGKVLCKWLVDAGLAGDSSEAIEYAVKLLQGNEIKSVNKKKTYFSTMHLYSF